MKIIESAIRIQLTQEEKDKINEAYEAISHLYDTMQDYEQEFVCSNDGSGYTMEQVRDTCNLMAVLITADKLRLEN